MALGTHDAINVLTNVFSTIPVTSVRHTLNASMFPVRCVGNIEAFEHRASAVFKRLLIRTDVVLT